MTNLATKWFQVVSSGVKWFQVFPSGFKSFQVVSSGFISSGFKWRVKRHQRNINGNQYHSNDNYTYTSKICHVFLDQEEMGRRNAAELIRLLYKASQRQS